MGPEQKIHVAPQLLIATARVVKKGDSLASVALLDYRHKDVAGFCEIDIHCVARFRYFLCKTVRYSQPKNPNNQWQSRCYSDFWVWEINHARAYVQWR